jgi:hypothetical protein
MNFKGEKHRSEEQVWEERLWSEIGLKNLLQKSDSSPGSITTVIDGVNVVR